MVRGPWAQRRWCLARGAWPVAGARRRAARGDTALRPPPRRHWHTRLWQRTHAMLATYRNARSVVNVSTTSLHCHHNGRGIVYAACISAVDA